jgi:hypothetical protein
MASGRRLDEKLVRIAAKLYQCNFTFKQLGKFFDLAESTIIQWQDSDFWIDEIENCKNEKFEFILKNTLMINKLKYFYDRSEENLQFYESCVKELLIKIYELCKRKTLNTRELRDLRTLIGSLKDMDTLRRDNLTYTFEIDDVLESIKDHQAKIDG